jgi:CRISPR/Cas system CSM-associated protein Csm3 (group 7 of RAMP superfamily)
MMYTTETISAGAKFSWRVVLMDITDIEWEVFLCGLAELARRPYLGGRSGTGHGHVEIHFDGWQDLDNSIRPLANEVANPLGKAYREHLEAKRGDIVALLAEMK